MVTKLNGQLRREVSIGGVAYVVTLSVDGLKLVEKGHRKGYELAWKDLVTGDAALAAALNASLRAAPAAQPARHAAPRPKRAKTRRLAH